MSKRVPVGVGVVVVRNGHLLVGHRLGAHGSNTWALPGGWLESDDESIEHCASRELAEETGLTALSLRVLDLAPFKQSLDGVHSVSVYVLAHTDHACEPEVREKDKCAEWRFIALRDQVPVAMRVFPALQQFSVLVFLRARGTDARFFSSSGSVLLRKRVLLEAELFPE